MKTKIYLIPVILFTAINIIRAQSVSSIANGDWMNPFTWSCTCVPIPGYTASSVNIYHHVTLDTSMILPSGAISVLNTGYLSTDNNNRDLYINGGNFTNYGKTDLHYVYLQTGAVNNYDTMYVKALATYADFNNYGYILNLDSLTTAGSTYNSGLIDVYAFYNTNTFQNHGAITNGVRITNDGTFQNYTGSYLYSDSLTNLGTFINSGRIGHDVFTNAGTYSNLDMVTFYNFANSGYFTNADSLIGVQNLYNAGTIINQTAAVTMLGVSFMNSDSAYHDAVFENDGYVSIGVDFYNTDTVKGVTGKFYVQNQSANSGSMNGSFDFCDLTPPATAPFIDYNTGTIAPGITYCIYLETKNPALENEFTIFPNPASDKLNIQIPNREFSWSIIEITGKTALSGQNAGTVGLSGLAPGLYIFKAVDQSGKIMITRRFIKE